MFGRNFVALFAISLVITNCGESDSILGENCKKYEKSEKRLSCNEFQFMKSQMKKGIRPPHTSPKSDELIQLPDIIVSDSGDWKDSWAFWVDDHDGVAQTNYILRKLASEPIIYKTGLFANTYYYPILNFYCQNSKISIRINFPIDQSDEKNKFRSSSVQIRYFGDTGSVDIASPPRVGEDRTSFQFDDLIGPYYMLEQLTDGRQLDVSVETEANKTVQATFDLSGLSKKAAPLMEQCKP